ncbi:hypothetical protein CNR22_18750 [Sphingobacteriaceae bacterium]|nr:hypothetical protein CNR22_18750 [Sphingobacteriaceae bacterium]
MKTILIPTDFSGPADTAFNYALSLAKNLNYKLSILHVYQVVAPIAEISFAVLNEERRMLKEEADLNLKLMEQKLKASGLTAYECLMEEGIAPDTILNYARAEKPEMIVMGNKGKTGAASMAFGSVSLKVIEKADCPVVAIPAEFNPGKTIKKITYATDYHKSDLEAIQKAVDLAQVSGAQLTILHICDSIIGADEEKTLMKNFMEKVENVTTYFNLSFQIIHGFNIAQRLEEYLEDQSTDMLMMATHYRSFFDHVFGKSITRTVSRHATIPVVAFHYQAKPVLKIF